MSGVEQAKRLAAWAAVEEFVEDNQVVGIGSGSTIVYAVEKIAQKVREEKWEIRCVPTSFQARNLILEHGLRLSDLSVDPVVDIAIDGADEVDEWMNCIKGGGGAHTQEKLVAFNAKKFVIVADHRKQSRRLGESWKQGVPLEVLPSCAESICKEIRRLGGNPRLRTEKGISDGPTVTDNGNYLVDADFGQIEDPRSLDKTLHGIPGIVETGLFVGLAKKAFFGQIDGSVVVQTPPA